MPPLPAQRTGSRSRPRILWAGILLAVLCAIYTWNAPTAPFPADPTPVDLTSWNWLGTRWEDNSVMRMAQMPGPIMDIGFPDDEAVRLAVTPHGIYRSKDRGTLWSPAPAPADIGEWPKPVRQEGPEFASALERITCEGSRCWVVGNDGRIFLSADTGKTWREQQSGTPDEWLESAFFLKGGRIGWIAGSGGTILRTTNGGSTWTRQQTGTANWLEDVFFIDVNTGWAVGWEGAILATNNGGEKWTSVPYPGSEQELPNLNAVRFRDPATGWIVGNNGTVFSTRDGGATWTRATISPNSNLNAIRLVEGGKPITVGTRGTILVGNESGEWEVFGGTVPDVQLNFLKIAPGGQLWTGGGGAVILSFDDSRNAWGQRHGITLNWVHMLDRSHAWAVGDNGVIVSSGDGGQTWQVQDSGTAANLFGVHFWDPRHGMASGMNGILLSTNDGGAKWVTRAPPQDMLRAMAMARDLPFNEESRQEVLGDLMFPAVTTTDWNTAIAIESSGVFIRTSNGGAEWELQEVVDPALRNLFSSPSAGIWAVGQSGAILQLTEAGWVLRAPSRPDVSDLNSVFFADGKSGWAVGEAGTILATRDGGLTWSFQDSPIRAPLYSVVFSGAERGWIAGAYGTFLSTGNGGQKWDQIRLGTVDTPLLGGIDFADARSGIAVGNSTLLFTQDGKTWNSPENRRGPPPVVWIGYLIALVLVLRGITRTVLPDDSPIGGLDSDEPIRDVKDDTLGHAPLVEALSEMLHNRDTKPPLTIAVTGPWGSGKTSLMGQLKTRLQEEEAFTPVWFNAWHHCTEEHLLGSLLEHIRSNAVPPWHTVRGTWFRSRLLWIRLRNNWPWIVPALAGTAAIALTAEPSTIYTLLISMISNANRGAEQFPPEIPYAWYTVLSAPWATLFAHGLRPFGLRSRTLIRNLARMAEVRSPKVDPGLRHQVRRYLGDISRALGDASPLVLFIDDLDRCPPDRVMRVLEFVNFINSPPSQTYTVIGLAGRQVVPCIASTFRDLAEEKVPKNLHKHKEGLRARAMQRWRDQHARHYLEKLINIPVSIENIRDADNRQTGGGNAPPAQAKRMNKETSPSFQPKLKRFLNHALIPFLIVVAIAYLGFTNYGPAQGSRRIVVPQVPPLPTVPQRTVNTEVSASRMKAEPRADVVGPKSPVYRGSSFFIYLTLTLTLVLAGIPPLRRYLADLPRPSDPKGFVRAQEVWRPLINRVIPTPRARKQLINSARFTALRMSSTRLPDDDAIKTGQFQARALLLELWHEIGLRHHTHDDFLTVNVFRGMAGRLLREHDVTRAVSRDQEKELAQNIHDRYKECVAKHIDDEKLGTEAWPEQEDFTRFQTEFALDRSLWLGPPEQRAGGSFT